MNSDAPIAIAAMYFSLPKCPAIAVSAIDISGAVMFATIEGSDIANISRLFFESIKSIKNKATVRSITATHSPKIKLAYYDFIYVAYLSFLTLKLSHTKYAIRRTYAMRAYTWRLSSDIPAV